MIFRATTNEYRDYTVGIKCKEISMFYRVFFHASFYELKIECRQIGKSCVLEIKKYRATSGKVLYQHFAELGREENRAAYLSAIFHTPTRFHLFHLAFHQLLDFFSSDIHDRPVVVSQNHHYCSFSFFQIFFILRSATFVPATDTGETAQQPRSYRM